MDVEIDKATPLIIGRPFLATGDAWIGVKDKIVVLQVNGEKLVLNVDKAMQYPAEPVQVHQVDQIEQCVQEVMEALVQNPSNSDWEMHSGSEDDEPGETIDFKAIFSVIEGAEYAISGNPELANLATISRASNGSREACNPPEGNHMSQNQEIQEPEPMNTTVLQPFQIHCAPAAVTETDPEGNKLNQVTISE